MTNILTTHQRDLRQHLVVEQEYKKELALKRQRDELIVSRELAKRFEQPAVKARFERCGAGWMMLLKTWMGSAGHGDDKPAHLFTCHCAAECQ